MKTSALLWFLFVIKLSTSLGMNWTLINSKVKYIYQPTFISNNLEILKLYENKQFEHLVYKESNGIVILDRNIGTYDYKESALKLYPAATDFESSIYNKELFYNGDLFETKFQSKYQQTRALLKKVSKLKFNVPFFIYPVTNELINNQEIEDHIDIDAYITFLTRFENNEENKIITILNYINENNSIITTSPTSTYSLSESEIKKICIQKSNTVESWKIAQLIKRLAQSTSMKLTCIEGFLKSSKHFNSSRLHQWLMIEKSNFKYLSDPASGKQWLKVSPEIMIKTHFPLNSDFQLMDQPITKATFETLPILELKNERVKYIPMIPELKQINVINELQLMFDSESFKIEVFNWDGENFQSLIPYSNFRKVSSRGKTLLTINTNQKDSKFVLEINDDYFLYFETIQSSIKKTEITTTNSKISRMKQPVTIQTNSYKSTNTLKNNTFTSDLINLKVIDQKLLEHPLIREASNYYGVSDIPGKRNNKQIILFFKETGHEDIKDDETSWCSVFMSYCVKELNGEYPKSASARSWLSQGISVNNPIPGDLVIFWRESPYSWKGHVGIFLGFDPETNEVITLGGNQDDMVKIKKYPSNQVLGYRRVF